MREKTDRPRRELWDQNDFEDLNSMRCWLKVKEIQNG